MKEAIVERLSDALRPVRGLSALVLGGSRARGIARSSSDYRDLAQVRAVVAECQAGQISMNYQPGHPHGFCSAIWMGEVATCEPLRDEAGVIAELKTRAWPFPNQLRRALISRFHWEVIFSIENAEIAIHRNEQTHIAGCAYRALCCVAQVLFAVNRRYLINEKGALTEADTFPETIGEVAGTAAKIWAAIGAREFSYALQLLRRMASDLDGLVTKTI